MTRLIVCCDGTWSSADDRTQGVPTPTNVARLYNAVPDADRGHPDQRRYYHSGVGTDRHWWQRLAGGALGIGLNKHIMSAYRWLGQHYQPGDELYIFGFSRGAFTARSLVGMMSTVGLLDLRDVGDDQAWPRVEAAYNKGYRQQQVDWRGDWPIHHDGRAVPVRFLGVWDTVGALGIPNDLAILNLFDDPARYAFHDTLLGEAVETARQAIALDERRASFTPTLWTGVRPDRDVEQRWFPGVHNDVGGGYLEHGLADIALLWMMNQAQTCGLALDARMKAHLQPDPQGVLHDSITGVFAHLRTRPRSTPPVTDATRCHESAIARHRHPPLAQAPYWPTVFLERGEQRTVSVFALQHWNTTGVYLERGARYAFHAEGQWMSGDDTYGPNGNEPEDSVIAKIKRAAHDVERVLESWYRHATRDTQADFIGTRREEALPWGSLVGAIANGGNPDADGSPAPHQMFSIGSNAAFPEADGETIGDAGYLYCFINDAWHFYFNNQGSVTLTVTRLR